MVTACYNSGSWHSLLTVLNEMLKILVSFICFFIYSVVRTMDLLGVRMGKGSAVKNILT